VCNSPDPEADGEVRRHWTFSLPHSRRRIVHSKASWWDIGRENTYP